jgi:hypothetical protein
MAIWHEVPHMQVSTYSHLMTEHCFPYVESTTIQTTGSVVSKEHPEVRVITKGNRLSWTIESTRAERNAGHVPWYPAQPTRLSAYVSGRRSLCKMR